MKVVGTNQLAPARCAQPLTKGLLADGWRSVRGKLRAPLLFGLTTALYALAVLLLSVLWIGELDRFGVAPQDSFLGLNLPLIAGCVFLLLSPLRWRILHRATQDASAASAAVKQIRAEPIGKLLIIRHGERVRTACGSGRDNQLRNANCGMRIEEQGVCYSAIRNLRSAIGTPARYRRRF